MFNASSPLPHVSPVDDARANRESRRHLLLVMAGFAIAAFVVTELMHYLLVPDLGPHRERLMAEGASALILGMLAAKLLQNAYHVRQRTLARLRTIAEVNHHVRNALEVISLSAYITQDEEAIRHITEGVNRIDWVLREILPRESFPPSTDGPPTGPAGTASPAGQLPGPGPDQPQADSYPPPEFAAHRSARSFL